jgi:hypothetical protein
MRLVAVEAQSLVWLVHTGSAPRLSRRERYLPSGHDAQYDAHFGAPAGQNPGAHGTHPKNLPLGHVCAQSAVADVAPGGEESPVAHEVLRQMLAWGPE